MTQHDNDDWPQPYRLLDAEPYWAALADRRLTYQHCGGCDRGVWPAHSRCPDCLAPDLIWRESAGTGTVYSHSTIERGPAPVWNAIVPYTVGFVEMDEGYFLFTQLDGDIAIGTRVDVRFVQRGAQVIPVFVADQDGDA